MEKKKSDPYDLARYKSRHSKFKVTANETVETYDFQLEDPVFWKRYRKEIDDKKDDRFNSI